MLLRTSIIGEEKHNNYSLVEWIKSKRGQEVDGYTNHLWNGITTTQFGKACEKIISENLYEKELYHIYSPQSTTKNDLVSLISDKLDLHVGVVPTEAPESIDRTLSTNKDLNEKLNIPQLSDQLENMVSINSSNQHKTSV